MQTPLPILLIDIDGTVLDVKHKYVAVHRLIARELEQEALPEERFWHLKRARAPTSVLLSHWASGIREEYERRWLSKIEAPAAVALDRLIPGAATTLDRLSRDFTFIGTTMRRSAALLRGELEALDVASKFEGLLVRGHSPTSSKEDLWKRSAYFGSEVAYVIGDSDDDVSLARALRAPSIVVTSGLRSEAYLRRLQPAAIIDSIVDLPSLLYTTPAHSDERGAELKQPAPDAPATPRRTRFASRWA